MPSRQRGQFDVHVDGESAIARKGGLIAMLTRKPWPNPEDVVTAVREATGG